MCRVDIRKLIERSTGRWSESKRYRTSEVKLYGVFLFMVRSIVDEEYFTIRSMRGRGNDSEIIPIYLIL